MLTAGQSVRWEEAMLRKVLWVAIFALLIAIGTLAQAGQYGTADEAKAMLDKAVAAVKEDKTKALDMFNKGEDGFKDRDLYVFCANATSGMETAHPTHKGENLRDIKDVNGFAFGVEMINTATEGKVSEIEYKWPRPGTKEPAEKHTFYTKVSDQICGVGYYK
jgi:signal transduction histidine kinase